MLTEGGERKKKGEGEKESETEGEREKSVWQQEIKLKLGGNLNDPLWHVKRFSADSQKTRYCLHTHTHTPQ